MDQDYAITVLKEALELARTDEPPERVLARALADLRDGPKRAPQRLADIIPGVQKETDMRADGQRQMVPLPWPDLHKLHDGGLRPGLHVLTGGSGVGKTGFALRVALEAARHGMPVLYAGLELDNVSVTARLAAQVDRCTPWQVFDWPRDATWTHRGDPNPIRRSKEQVREAFSAALDELQRLPIVVSDPPAMGWTTDDLQNELRTMRELHSEQLKNGKPILVVVDFLQLMGPTGDPDDRDLRGRIRRAAYTARQLTRSHDVCMLLVSSVSRENYPRLTFDATSKPPKQSITQWPPSPVTFIGMGKESGEIEYAAHSVTTLCKDESRPGGVWAVVAKNRTGRDGYVALHFAGAQGLHWKGDDEARKMADLINKGERVWSKDDMPPKDTKKASNTSTSRSDSGRRTP